MRISYDDFIGTFLAKITEFDFAEMSADQKESLTEGYMKRAVVQFQSNCKYDLAGNADDVARMYQVDIPDAEVDEITEIVSEGMLIQWMKPFVYRQENLENVLNTADFTTYSPAELLYRIGNAYAKVQSDYTQMIREYSFVHGNLKGLHL